MIDFFSKVKNYGLLILGGLVSVLYLLLKHERNVNKKLEKENGEVKEANEVSNVSIKKKEQNTKDYREAQDKINAITPRDETANSASKSDTIVTGSNYF